MPNIGPVTDQYIDSIIKSAGVANPNLSKTQGTGMRELIKLLRDRLEQQSALAYAALPDGVIYGLGLSIVDQQLTVAAGVWKIGSIFSRDTPTILTLNAKDSTLSRYDVVYANTLGEVGVVTGTSEDNPAEPAIPENSIRVGAILVTPESYTPSQPDLAGYVDLFSTQTINAVKTFEQSPVVPVAVNNNQAVNLGQLDDLISSLPALNFNNGLTNTNGKVQLGGPLTADTAVTLDSHVFSVLGATSSLVVSEDKDSEFGVGVYLLQITDNVTAGINASGSNVGMFSNGNATAATSSGMYFDGTEGTSQLSITSNDNTKLLSVTYDINAGMTIFYRDYLGGISVNFNTNSMDVAGPPSFGGIKYQRDYSGEYSERSLVDRAYVDNAIGGGGSGGSYTFGNGLTNSGTGNVGLGGSLSAYTLLDFNGHGMEIKGFGDILCSLTDADDTHIFHLRVAPDNDGLSFGTTLVGGTASDPYFNFNINNQAIAVIEGNDAIFSGLLYKNDYSANYTERSLVDKAYVDAAIAKAIAAL